MNLELRVQKAQPDVAPAAPRRAVVKVLRISPILLEIRIVGGGRRRKSNGENSEREL